MNGAAAIDWLGGIDPRIWQAVIAGGFVALGWIYHSKRSRREARRLRAEKLRDVHRALYAEIGAYLHNLEGEAELDAFRAAMLERMRTEPDYVPLIPSERQDTIFAAITPEIHVLPRTTIDAVVLFYRQLGAISALIEDMRGERFRTGAPEMRCAIYSDYIEMKKQALRYGIYSLRLIRAFAEGGKMAARAEEEAIRAEGGTTAVGTGLSSPGADRSARSSE